MQIVVHAGMHKTGTTMFQEALHTNRSMLLESGIRFLTPKDGLELSRAGFADVSIADLLSSTAAEGTKTLVFSHEAISLLDRSVLSGMRAALQPYPVRFVIVFRHWCSYLPSRWAQNCKRRDGASFHGFQASFETERPWFRFDRVLRNARDAGFEEITAISHDAPKNTLLRDLTEACHLVPLPEMQPVNQSLPIGTLEKLRLFNAARAELDNLPKDALLSRLQGSRDRVKLFNQAKKVIRTLDKMPALDQELDELIDRTQVEVSLDPKQFEAHADKVEHLAGMTLFRDVHPHHGTYSTLEFGGLPSRTRRKITAALTKAPRRMFRVR